MEFSIYPRGCPWKSDQETRTGLFFFPFLSRNSLCKPNVVFRFRQNLALLQSRLNIFFDYLDEFGIRRYPILVVAHASHKERWTVTNERLILVGPREI